MTSCCKLLAGVPYSCSCPPRSGQNGPINLQKDYCYFLFCNFLISMWMERYFTFNGPSLENRLSCIFQAIVNILLWRCRSSMTKLRQQSTSVRARGIDQVWNQIFFFPVPVLLHPQFSNPSMNFTSSNLQLILQHPLYSSISSLQWNPIVALWSTTIVTFL